MTFRNSLEHALKTFWIYLERVLKAFGNSLERAMTFRNSLEHALKSFGISLEHALKTFGNSLKRAMTFRNSLERALKTLKNSRGRFLSKHADLISLLEIIMDMISQRVYSDHATGWATDESRLDCWQGQNVPPYSI
jgi:ribosomal protein S21